MHAHSRSFRLTAAVAVSALLAAQALPWPVLAQGAPPPQPGTQDQQGGDPPERVGRLARVSGTVSFHTQDDDQWSPATANYPVYAGNAFWTEPNAQAEIEISASRIMMAPGSELDITSLTDTAFQATEAQGEIYLRLRPGAPDETYAVQTPRGLVTLAVPGRYGIAAGDTQNPTMVTVLEGSAQVTAPGVALDVAPDQSASITGTDNFEGNIGPAQRDAFLMAMLDRERPPPPPQGVSQGVAQRVAAPQIVDAMPGGEDLAAYGSWSDVPEYGQVWYPQVAQDWVPYRDGRWAYVAPWGWTWVDSAPWGFAPFHYGRWAEFHGRWGWVPGVERDGFRRPVYAPALVTFLGVGAAVGVGVGIGAALAGGRVGWVPLGPREPFHPWYRASDNYFRQVNVAHVTNITTINRNVTVNNFSNQRFATVVPAGAMTGSRPVRGAFQRVDPAQLAQARPVIGQQPLRPAATTVGVTPAVARQLSLPPTAGATRQTAPGPSIRATPAGGTPGFAAGGPGRPGTPPLFNAGPAAVPTAAGTRPITGTPPLGTPGGTPRPGFAPNTATPALANPGTPAANPFMPRPSTTNPGTPNLAAPGGAPGPGIAPRPGAPTLATPGGTTGPGLMPRTPNPATPGGAPGPAITPRPGTPTLATPSGPAGPGLTPRPPTPNLATPGGAPGPGFAPRPGAPTLAAPSGTTGPGLTSRPPSPGLATPGGQPGQGFTPRPVTPPPAAGGAGPGGGPAQFHAAPVAPPPPQVHAPPPPQVHAPSPPPPAFHPPPSPPPQVHTPPPPQAQFHAPPPAAARVVQAPPPQFHPPPAAPVAHAAPPPQPQPAARPAPQGGQQHKRPGEP